MPLWAGFLLVESSEGIQLGFQLVEPTRAYSSEREASPAAVALPAQ